MTRIKPQPGIMDIALYQGGKARVEGVDHVVKLSSNENPLGPSPAAMIAFAETAAGLHLYPNTDHKSLREAIASVHGLDARRVICGVGSDEIIDFLCRAYVGPGDEVVHTEHAFGMYRISALASGATPVEVPENQRVTDVDAILSTCNDRTRLVFVTAPNNPTGVMLSMSEITRLADQMPQHAILAIDAAYAEYVEGFDGGAALVEARENVVMMRTFSKIYGLGGLRVGWGYGPGDIIDVLNRVRGPFNLSVPALAAAEAAVLDQEWVAACRSENAAQRQWLAQTLAELGVPSDPSSANFILARFADEAEARACLMHLEANGLLVRHTASFNLPAALRITIGDVAACKRVADAVAAFKGK